MSRQAASEDDFDLPMPGHLGHRNMRSWLISFVFHLGILLLLALYVLPGFSPRSVQSLKGSFASDDKLAPQFSIASATFGELTFDDEEIESPAQVPISPVIAQVTAGDLEHTEVIDPGTVKMLTSRSTVGVAKPSLRMVRPASGTRAIRRSTSMADAVSGVGDSIRGELLQGDTLVVWLLDASISLRDDRATMAWHARQLYESIGSLAPRSDDAMDGHTLLSSVVAFGSGWQEIAKPMQDGSQAIDAMKNVPIDTTGHREHHVGDRSRCRIVSPGPWASATHVGRRAHGRIGRRYGKTGRYDQGVSRIRRCRPSDWSHRRDGLTARLGTLCGSTGQRELLFLAGGQSRSRDTVAGAIVFSLLASV